MENVLCNERIVQSDKKSCKNLRKKAQVSIEYTLVIGLIIVALTIVVAVALSYSTSAKHQIIMNQIDKVGKKIVETTDTVYYLGPPSKATIDLTMPSNIQSILINRAAKSITFKFTGSTGDAYSIYYFKANINGVDALDQPLDKDTFKSAGLKHLIITAGENSNVTLVSAF
ncbi:MAG: hypothetical protein NTX24_03995 [Candidatus Pacearchaeota archaeon]|nr:hypothetical protein [Candidatus Pacearchaeota archaeon]